MMSKLTQEDAGRLQQAQGEVIDSDSLVFDVKTGAAVS